MVMSTEKLPTSKQWRNLVLLALADTGEANNVNGAVRVVDQGAFDNGWPSGVNRNVYGALAAAGLAEEAWIDRGRDTWCRITAEGRSVVTADAGRFRKAAKDLRRKARG